MPDVTIREIRPEDYAQLEEFLYLAIYQRDAAQPIPRTVIGEPEVHIYIDAFGQRADDMGVVAEIQGRVIGAAWARVLDGDPQGYGFVDAATPELAVSLLPAYRGRGIGTRLLRSLLGRMAAAGYARTSLSVDKDNPASRLYTRLGYQTIAERGEDLLMVRRLTPEDQRCI